MTISVGSVTKAFALTVCRIQTLCQCVLYTLLHTHRRRKNTVWHLKLEEFEIKPSQSFVPSHGSKVLIITIVEIQAVHANTLMKS